MRFIVNLQLEQRRRSEQALVESLFWWPGGTLGVLCNGLQRKKMFTRLKEHLYGFVAPTPPAIPDDA